MEIRIGSWYSVPPTLISTDWRIWTRLHAMTCLGQNPHCGRTRWWRPRPGIGQRAVEHAEWHSMVENSLKYDDLPMALVAGRWCPHRAVRISWKTHPFMKLLSDEIIPPTGGCTFIFCRRLQISIAFAGSGLYGWQLFVLQIFLTVSSLSRLVRLGN